MTCTVTGTGAALRRGLLLALLAVGALTLAGAGPGAGRPPATGTRYLPAAGRDQHRHSLRRTGQRRPILLLAHIDGVAAAASDWSAEPFKFLERDGYVSGCGSGDNKFMASARVANLIRDKQEGSRPDRDLMVALETDEEILDANTMGIRWLLANHRDLIDAEFALNEGGGVGLLNGKPVTHGVQTSEKVSQSLQFEVRNPGGHRSLPSKPDRLLPPGRWPGQAGPP